MIYSKSFVRLVMSLATAVLVLCQTAAAALTYGGSAAPARVAALQTPAEAPCHLDGMADQGGAPRHGCHDRCPAHDASLETAKLHIPAAAALALTLFTLAPPACAGVVAAPAACVRATAAPPPLILLYCRLLN